MNNKNDKTKGGGRDTEGSIVDIPANDEGFTEASNDDQNGAPEMELPETIVLTRDQMIEFKTQIDALQADRDEYLNVAQRTQADFENFRKRNAQVRTESYEEGLRDTVLSMLPVLDNLDRALDAAQERDENSSLCEGVRLVIKQFTETLNKLEVREIEALGKAFDPQYHDAVAQQECDEGQEPGMVLEVFMKGYMHKDKVLRHSMIKVGQ